MWLNRMLHTAKLNVAYNYTGCCIRLSQMLAEFYTQLALLTTKFGSAVIILQAYGNYTLENIALS